jgi:hypothetical protein
MAYTTDRTWVTGEVVTAALMNTYVRDNVKWLSTDKPMVRCYNTANLTSTTGVVLTLTYNTNRFDNASMHSITSLTNRITVSTANAGKYLVGMSVQWTASIAGDYRAHVLRITGTTNIGYDVKPPGGTNGFAGGNVTALWNLSNDYFDSAVQQNSGGNLDVTGGGGSSPEFWAVWVGI